MTSVPATTPAVFQAYEEHRIYADNGMIILERVPRIEGGALVGLFAKTAYYGVLFAPVQGPNGTQTMEYKFEIQGAGDLMDAFTMLPEQVERGTQEFKDMLNRKRIARP